MLGPGTRSLRLTRTTNRKTWICRRCFYAQSRLYAEQESEQDSDPSTPSTEQPVSPFDAFRIKFNQTESSNETPKQPPSPADVFRSNWMNLPSPDKPAVQNSQHLSLSDLAEAYRKTRTPRKYAKTQLWSPEPTQKTTKPILRDVKDTSDLVELSQLDEIDSVSEGLLEIFGGEITRDYQGVIPLNGEQHVQRKYPLRRGALVETRGEYASLGVIITDRYLESHRLCYALNYRGRLFICRPSAAVFVYPDFAPLDEVTRIDQLLRTEEESTPKRPDRVPPAPSENAQEYNELLNALSLRLLHLKMETDTAIRQVRRNYKSVYALLKHEDPMKTASAFIPDVAKMLFNTEKPSHIQLYATHKILADDMVHFATDPTNHLESTTFLVRANRDILAVSRVANWIRESSAEAESFLSKARQLIAISRQLPKTTLPTKLDVNVPPDLYFNGNDRLIIEFISGYITGRRGYVPTDLLALAPLIIKRTGMYPSEITPNPDRNAAKLFMTEIGVWQPSENIPVRMDAGISIRRIYHEQTVSESFGDMNANIRHDFGEMPVYTIDDASAHELDDGISIEQTDQGKWLHIHIANPSAFLPPDSRIAGLARLRQTSLYLPDRMNPMLPVYDEHFSAKGFSRSSNVTETMTFSARLSDDGNIANFKVRPGLVRNVKVLTYDDVNAAIFPGEEAKRNAWWTESYSSPDYNAMGKQFDQITPEAQSHLRAIEYEIQKHRDWRLRHGALRIQFPSASVKVNPKPLEWVSSMAPKSSKSDLVAARKTVPSFVRGNAGVMLSIGDQSSLSRSLIEEMMIIAGRIAGLFAQQHNIPVAYRGLTTNIPRYLREECHALHVSGIKQLPLSLSRQILSTTGGWLLQQSPTPQNHDLLGISAQHGGYVQVTSPLRRYLDILAHWQFEAHLRGSSPPFTLAQLMGAGEFSLLQASRRLYRRTLLTRKFHHFYAAHAVSQLVADPYGVGSTHLEFTHGKPRLTGYLIDKEIAGSSNWIPRLVAVKELGVQGRLVLDPDEKVPEVGREFSLQIREVNDVEGEILFGLTRES